MFQTREQRYPMLRYPWADARAALLSMAANDPQLPCAQITYVNPQTGEDAENILGYYALMLRPGQRLSLPARSPATRSRAVHRLPSLRPPSPWSRPTLAARRALPRWSCETSRTVSRLSCSWPMSRPCTASWGSMRCAPDGIFRGRLSPASPTPKKDTNMSPSYIFEPPAVASLPIRGRNERFAVHRIFCAGRNYHAHAAEMGRSVDKSVDPPFYFTKTPQTLVPSGATVAYPPGTQNYHYEMELVVALGKPGFRVDEADAHGLIYGYASGLDMTRRDLQLFARDKGRPWDLGKDFEESAVCSEIVPMAGVALEQAEISLQVNGQIRQSSNIDKLLWNVRELIADLSRFYHLQPGDLIYTGTPEGVGAVVSGDRLSGRVVGVADVELTIGPAR